MKAKWLPLPDGPHQGETCPQVFLHDPGYLLVAAKDGALHGAVLDQARDVCQRATRVRAPHDDGPDVTVFYFLQPNAKFSGYSVVSASDPEYKDYERCAAAVTNNRLDLTLPARLAPDDPLAALLMVESLKHRLLGDPHAVLTRKQCEGFFDDPQNFVPSASSRLAKVRLREGTRFRSYVDQFKPQAFQVLDHYREVEVLKLALEPGETAFFLMDGRVIAVDYDDDVRDEPEAAGEPDALLAD